MKSKFFTTRYHFADLAVSTLFMLTILATPVILIVFFIIKPTIGMAIFDIIVISIFAVLFMISRNIVWLDKYRYTKRVCSEAGKIAGIHFIQSVL